MGLFTQPIHPAVELAFQVWAWIGGIWLVWWIIMKITKVPAKVAQSNKMIEDAKYLPGGMYYQTPEEFAEENEELGYRAHA